MKSDHQPHLSKEAVALRYQLDKDEAPRIVAKGRFETADRIIKKAKEAGIPIQEDETLVRLLSQLDLNQVIPAELYQAVAEVFVFLYQLDNEANKTR
ncbi:MAG TPA: EscU/YscU/HrcU family type III secretion system export apparatus switch protein [Candidatus Angelobacter sp.]|nr:EscU/YscU/HrcU family type III secretion system export apparatus switch protein [Candidatus Angelobacter sp.]